MLAALIATAVLAALAVTALVVGGERRRIDEQGPSLVGKTLVVNTRKPDDQTVRGVLHGDYADRLTLREATYVTGLGETPADGLVHMLKANIAFVQEIEG